MMKTFLAITLSVMVCLVVHSQTVEQLEANKQRVVTITLNSNDEKGHGFIIGASDSTVYVVTANHVIERRDKSDPLDIDITIDNKSYPGLPIAQTDSGSKILHNDIALIKVVIPGFRIKPCVVIEDPDNCEDLFFIKYGENKIKYPQKSFGSFEYWADESTNAYIIYLKEIESGDSGSALFERDTIAGMIVSKRDSRSNVVSMKRIDEMVSKYLPVGCRFRFIKRSVE